MLAPLALLAHSSTGTRESASRRPPPPCAAVFASAANYHMMPAAGRRAALCITLCSGKTLAECIRHSYPSAAQGDRVRRADPQGVPTSSCGTCQVAHWSASRVAECGADAGIISYREHAHHILLHLPVLLT